MFGGCQSVLQNLSSFLLGTDLGVGIADAKNQVVPVFPCDYELRLEVMNLAVYYRAEGDDQGISVLKCSFERRCGHLFTEILPFIKGDIFIYNPRPSQVVLVDIPVFLLNHFPA